MEILIARADDVLRRRRWNLDSDSPLKTVAILLALLIASGGTYGAVLGTFGGIDYSRFEQILYSAIKVPLLLLSTFALSVPSFYVLNMLLGVGSDFRLAMRALVSTQTGIAIVLASLAPYTIFWYASFAGYGEAILFNALMFAIASLAGQWMLRQDYRELVRRNPKHKALMIGWIIIYAGVGIQMGWILRPFVGSPGVETVFLRQGDWTNAYVVVGRLIFRLFQ